MAAYMLAYIGTSCLFSGAFSGGITLLFKPTIYTLHKLAATHCITTAASYGYYKYNMWAYNKSPKKDPSNLEIPVVIMGCVTLWSVGYIGTTFGVKYGLPLMWNGVKWIGGRIWN